jgi:hypothetical protein
VPKLAVFLGFLLSLVGCVYVDEPPPLERNEEAYGPCEDEYNRVVCLEDPAACDFYPDVQFPEMTVCTTECTAETDCAVPATGDAVVKCGGEPAACVLECADGETCPDGMTCAPTGNCMWPA